MERLLKILLLAILAASLSLIFPSSAQATDHPWDDSGVDTAEVLGTGNEGIPVGNPGTKDDDTDRVSIFERLRSWIAVFWFDLKHSSVTQQDQGKGRYHPDKRDRAPRKAWLRK